MDFQCTVGGISVKIEDNSADVVDAAGKPKGKPTPQQWAAFIAAVLAAIMGLFEPATAVAGTPGPVKK